MPKQPEGKGVGYDVEMGGEGWRMSDFVVMKGRHDLGRSYRALASA